MNDQQAPERKIRIPLLILVGVAAVVIAAVAGLALTGGDDDGPTESAAEPAAAGIEAGGSEDAVPVPDRFAEGEVLPAVGVELFDGTEATLADFRGQPLVINFWASWCPSCVSEMPDFEEVHQRFDGEVAFLGLALQDDRGAAERLAAETGVTYPLAEDDGSIYTAFRGISMPTTIFVDAEGRFVDRFNGALTASALEAMITEVTQAA